MRDFFEQVRKSIEVELESISMDSCDISVDGQILNHLTNFEKADLYRSNPNESVSI
jgi:hypothetical protein